MGYLSAESKPAARTGWQTTVVTKLRADMRLLPPYVSAAQVACPQGQPLEGWEAEPESGQQWFRAPQMPEYCPHCWEASNCPRHFGYALGQHETLFGLIPLASRVSVRLLRQVRPWIEPAQSFEKNQLGLGKMFFNSLRLTWQMSFWADSAVLLRTRAWLFALFLDKSGFSKFQEIQSLFNSPPFEFGELGFSQDDGEIEIMVQKNGLRLPITRVGSGLQQILFLIATIVFHKNKLLGIEDLEINLSPRAQREIFEKLKTFVDAKPQVLDQVLVTSHSDYFEHRDDVRCFAVEYDNNEACSIISPWNDVKQKKYFGRTRVDRGGWDWD